jgi:hypothetical protein
LRGAAAETGYVTSHQHRRATKAFLKATMKAISDSGETRAARRTSCAISRVTLR